MTPWLVFAALAALAAAALALPILRRRGAPARRAEFDLAVFRRQLADLEADAANGVIDETEARAARIEIERRILAAAGSEEDGAGDRGRTSAALTVAVGVPLLSLAIYALIGSPDAPDRPLAASVEEAIESLAARLRENPDDLGGWLLLARSYTATERHRAAAEAFDNAAALAPDDADIAAAHGEALFHAAGGAVTPAAARRFDAALAIDPLHPGARYYRGMAAAQAGDLAGAFDIWRTLVESAEPDAPWLPEVRRQLRAVAAESGIEPPSEPEEQRAAIDGMVGRLEARLRDDPENIEGWRRLGRAKRVLGDLPAAREAYGRAVDLAPDDLPALAGLAEVERELGPADEPVPDPALAIYRRILMLDAEHPDALWFLGLAASDAGRREEAAALWDRLLVQLPPDSEPYRLIAERLAALRNGG